MARKFVIKITLKFMMINYYFVDLILYSVSSTL